MTSHGRQIIIRTINSKLYYTSNLTAIIIQVKNMEHINIKYKICKQHRPIYQRELFMNFTQHRNGMIKCEHNGFNTIQHQYLKYINK